MSGNINAWGGRGGREVTLTTFLPSVDSPFYDGTSSETILAELRRWQDSGELVRLIISGSDINDQMVLPVLGRLMLRKICTEAVAIQTAALYSAAAPWRSTAAIGGWMVYLVTSAAHRWEKSLYTTTMELEFVR